MTLPEPFSDIEHLQLTVRRYLNKQIREDFRDLFGSGDTWEPEIGTTRGAMLRALLHEDSDPIAVTTTRLMLYYFTYGKAQKLQTPMYGIPIAEYNEKLVFSPQIELYFSEALDEVDTDFQPLHGRIKFRLAGETNEGMTRAKAETYARKVKLNFTPNDGFRWHKGWHRANYYDKKRGYDLRLNVSDKAEGKRIVEQVLDIQSHTPNWELFGFSERDDPSGAFPTVPGTDRIYGQTRKLPRKRPRGYVRFRIADLHIYPMPRPVTLVDMTGRRTQAIVKHYEI